MQASTQHAQFSTASVEFDFAESQVGQVEPKAILGSQRTADRADLLRKAEQLVYESDDVDVVAGKFG